MPQIFSNNASTTLAVAINNSATTISVSDGSVFSSPTGGDYELATIGFENVEIVKITARSSNTLTVVRGQEGTTASAWDATTPIEGRITKGALSNFYQINQASGTNAIAIGSSASASGTVAIAIGNGATANATQAQAAGDNANAGAYATAVGSNANASGQGSVSVGYAAVSSGSSGVSIGDNASTVGSTAIAIGKLSSSPSANSVAIGTSAHSGQARFGYEYPMQTGGSVGFGPFGISVSLHRD